MQETFPDGHTERTELHQTDPQARRFAVLKALERFEKGETLEFTVFRTHIQELPDTPFGRLINATHPPT